LARREKKKEPKSTGTGFTPYVIAAGLIGIGLTIYVGYQAYVNDVKLIRISMLALIAGLMFESFRVSDNWSAVIRIFVGTYLLSFLSFLPRKHENIYHFENHINHWPYYFIFIFAVSFVRAHKDMITAKLSEGITLVLSVSMIYWLIDAGFIVSNNWGSVFITIAALLLSVFSIVNGLTHIPLTKTVRLLLSIWSTVILFAFALNNIIKVFKNPEIENSRYLSEGLSIGLQYFFVGVSAVYIMRNYKMLTNFLPNKNSNYTQQFKENKEDHIERFSSEQVNIRYSLLCVLIAGSVFLLNYTYQIMPPHTAIWLVFFVSSILLKLSELLNARKREIR
jgi:hypothetical protein